MLGKILQGLGITAVEFENEELRNHFEETCLTDISPMNFLETELENEDGVKYKIEIFND